MKRWQTVLLATGVVVLTSHAAPPLPVTDLQILVMDSAHVRLDWSPVNQDTLGNPLDCIFYDVHRSQAPGFLPTEATWIDSTSATTLTDSLSGELGFYRVKVQSCPAADPLDMASFPPASS